VAYSDTSAPTQGRAIFRLSVGTLETQQLTSPPAQYIGDREPNYSPDGQLLAFVRQGAGESDDLYVMPASGGEPRRLTFDNKFVMGLAWTPDGGSIVFSSYRGGTASLWRIAAGGGDPAWLGLTSHLAIDVTISREGNRLVYGEGGDRGVIFWRLDLPAAPGRSASRTKALSTTSGDSGPRISPDGSRLAFASDRGGTNEIWVSESDGSNPQQLTKIAGIAVNPRWSPDGRFIAFQERLESQFAIYVVGANGGEPRRLTDGSSDDEVPSWSHDGRFVYFSSKRSGEFQVWKIPSEGGEAVQVTEHGGLVPFESPDGEYLYYSRMNNGLPGVYRIPVGPGDETLVLEHPSLVGWCGHQAWAVGETGIYFLDWRKSSGFAVEFYNLSTRRVTRVAAMEKDDKIGGSLSLSPDGRSLLYVQSEGKFIDFMLVEDFH
jgi:Tol biopolymer transport system component